MSERLLRLMSAAAVTVSALLATAPAMAVPDPNADSLERPDDRPLSQLLTELRQQYRQAEVATETYNATAEQLKKRQAEVARLDIRLTRARLALQDSRAAVGLLARQQYRSSMEVSSYLRLLMARDPQHVFDQGHVIAQLARERAKKAQELAVAARHADELARAARKARDRQLALAERQRKKRDDVQRQLKDVEELLASLSPEQLAALSEYERSRTETAQRSPLSSGALGPERTPAQKSDRALGHAVGQLVQP
ncbi:hypothetical protein ABZ876_00690 [Streptomyces sp. NPDC046931]|uniref:coiled-coil domain-containing protein n=1 Tax=Streptomyces sp. NPDC046931 TaxID=3154806 RepID=UPI0033C3F517